MSPPAWRLGRNVLDPPLLLAPMAGFTDAPMRALCGRQGAALTCTEMANARAVADAAAASWALLETADDEGPVAAQLYGADPETVAAAAERVAAAGRHAAIDLNCGCPAPKVMQCGAGAALMADPARIGRIVRATVARTALPVTVKTRLGMRPGEGTDVLATIVREAADNGAAAVTVHARYASQYHTGPIHVAPLERAVALGRLPIVGNGGVRDPATAQALLAVGVAAVMVGWAAVGNPWVFRRLRAALDRAATPPPDPDPDLVPLPVPVPVAEVRSMLATHLRRALDFKRRLRERFPRGGARTPPEEDVVRDFRGHLFRYLNGMQGVARLRARLASLRTLAEVDAAVDACCAAETAFRARIGRL